MSLASKFIKKTSSQEFKNDFPGFQGDLEECINEGQWLLFPRYGEGYADDIYNMELRDDDVWITTYPKSGTTWMQSMVWLLLNDLQFDESKHLDDFSPHVDLDQVLQREKFVPILKSKLEKYPEDKGFCEEIKDRIAFMEKGSLRVAEEIPRDSRRLLKSHLPFALMPPNVLKKNKVIFVARDPRDVALSYYRHQRLMKYYDFQGDFPKFLEYFLRDEIVGGPFWNYIHQGWAQRNNPNVLFVFFSDMKKDLRATIRRVITFLDLPEEKYSESDIDRLVSMVSLESFKGNEVVDGTAQKVRLGLYNDQRGGLVGKGKVGGWREIFTSEMKASTDAWTKDRTKGLDLPLDKLYPA